jgi:hypothetical protein
LIPVENQPPQEYICQISRESRGGFVRIVAVGAGIVVGIAALGGAAPDASGRPVERQALHAPAVHLRGRSSTGLVEGAFCSLIGNNKVQAAGVALLGYFLKKKISTTSIYTTAALTSVSVLCKPVMKYAVPAIARFLRLAPRPKRTPKRSEYFSRFGQASAGSVSQQLQNIGWNRSARDVYNMTSDLCTVVRRGVSPRPTLAYWFPNGKLDSLRVLDGLVAYAATCRPRLTPLQLGYLTSSITSYLTDNTYVRDYTPPVTTLYTPTETLQSDGLVRVNIQWSSFDFGGRVAQQALFIGTNGYWYQLSQGVAYVRPGQRYHIATRARDAAGNWSSWVYTPVYRARTS